jgi:hypothetical protein
VSTAPQIYGYLFGEQLLEHRLATVWRGRSVTGMEVAALVLTDAGAADPEVRDRLARASRSAALTPGEAEAPLWAANLTTTNPYAITQLAPGFSGAERLLDPLDGVIGNDQSAIAEVRARLERQPSPLPSPLQDIAALRTAEDFKDEEAVTATGLPTSPKSVGWKLWAVPVVVPLVVFAATYSVGASVNAAAADDEPTEPRQPVPAAVQPSALPTKVLLPGLPKAPRVALRTGVPDASVVGGRTFVEATHGQIDVGLPFAMHAPGKGGTRVQLEESSYAIYRRITYGKPPNTAADIWIAAHPCTDLAGCLADRQEFENRWTKRFKAQLPATAKDARTWFTETRSTGGTAYEVSMTRAYRSPATKSWWLVGVDASAATADTIQLTQAVVNDIRTQTS